MSDLLGKIDYQGRFLGQVASDHLAEPIRRWFRNHPHEIAPQNYFSVSFDRQNDGRYRCYLDLVGRHHWRAVESGTTLPQALKRSLDSALPDVVLTDMESAEL
ncbi:MAG: hypothetical protein KF865_00275 [Bdellovibrionaceae bacterium]|nr:hypothetical protein [Pseudobdellovibrionaceae bacterium]